MQKILLSAALMLAVGAIGAVEQANAQDAPYCREYQETITVGGKVRESYGTACMQPDGSWKKLTTQHEQADDATAQVQVVPAQQPVVIRQVVYDEPAYYYAPQPLVYPSVGLSFGFNDWGRHGGWGHGYGGHGGWR